MKHRDTYECCLRCLDPYSKCAKANGRVLFPQSDGIDLIAKAQARVGVRLLSPLPPAAKGGNGNLSRIPRGQNDATMMTEKLPKENRCLGIVERTRR